MIRNIDLQCDQSIIDQESKPQLKGKFMRYLIRCCFLSILLLFPALLGVCQETSGHKSLASAPEANELWETFGYAEGRFSIQFPKTPEVHTAPLDSSGQVVSHKYSVTTRAEYAVMYADYAVKIDGSAAANRVLDEWAKYAIAVGKSELLSMKEISLADSPGREVKGRQTDGAMTWMKMFVVGQRLYQIAVVLPRLKNAAPEEVTLYEQAASKFLNSFKLAESSSVQTTNLDCKSSAYTATDIGALDGRALKLGRPPYPDVARAAHAEGRVIVEVLVDTTGKVIDAKAVSGHPLLRDASVQAARESLFSPTTVSGQAVCVKGKITFKFVYRF
jgi:TonB family protein